MTYFLQVVLISDFFLVTICGKKEISVTFKRLAFEVDHYIKFENANHYRLEYYCI